MSKRKKTHKPTHELTHISRNFSAVDTFSRFFLLGTLIAVFSINVVQSRHMDGLAHDRRLLTTKPASAITHTTLAERLWQDGYINQAKHELALAQDDTSSAAQKSVLGAATISEQLLQQWERQPAQLRSTYGYWEQIIHEHPDYRDAYIQSATYAYQLGDTETAQIRISQALRIDPNAVIAQKVHDTIIK